MPASTRLSVRSAALLSVEYVTVIENPLAAIDTVGIPVKSVEAGIVGVIVAAALNCHPNGGAIMIVPFSVFFGKSSCAAADSAIVRFPSVVYAGTGVGTLPAALSAERFVPPDAAVTVTAALSGAASASMT